MVLIHETLTQFCMSRIEQVQLVVDTFSHPPLSVEFIEQARCPLLLSYCLIFKGNLLH